MDEWCTNILPASHPEVLNIELGTADFCSFLTRRIYTGYTEWTSWTLINSVKNYVPFSEFFTILPRNATGALDNCPDSPHTTHSLLFFSVTIFVTVLHARRTGIFYCICRNGPFSRNRASLSAVFYQGKMLVKSSKRRNISSNLSSTKQNSLFAKLKTRNSI